MKRYIGPILIVLTVAFAVIATYRSFKEKTVQADRQVDAARIKSDYLERVGWIRSNPDEKSYKDEVSTFFRWYFKEVNDHLNRFHGNKEFDDYLAELDKRAGKGGKGDPQAAEKKAQYEYTKKLFDEFQKGSYEPTWSASDKGMRLDVRSAKVEMIAGKPQIRFMLLLWGAQRELRDDGKLKKMATSSSWGVNFKLWDEKGKLFGEMNASGDPSSKVDYPERYIEQFPPQMVLGHYDLDLVPAEVAKMEIAFNIVSRAPSGGEANASYTWKLDTPPEWRLKAGEKWEGAQESVRPEDEIDPSKRQANK
ncbi:MAG: hypothetical protein ACT4TC_25385 [Myxococcaceae bacterium]